MKPRIIFLGGSGMLRPAATAMLQRGTTVVAAARRPLRLDDAGDGDGELVTVQGDWRYPDMLGVSIRKATGGNQVQGAIVWVHTPYRRAVMDELEGLIEPTGTALHVWGSASEDPRDVMAREADILREWKVRNLVLGYRVGPASTRWLTNSEISQAAIRAWDSEGNYFVAGTVDPWSNRP